MEFFNQNEVTIILRITIAVVLGIAVGLQREKRKTISKIPGVAGLRTHVLVALGSALITSVGVVLFSQDPVRLAASIMTGIGFIGAGTIIATKEKIKGLTTAASIWVAAAIGIVVGMGAYTSAVIAAIFTIAILELKRFESVE